MAFVPPSVNRSFIASVLLALLVSTGCEPAPQNPGADHAPAQPQPAGTSQSRGDIRAGLAPFDRYPSGARFPLVFRFTEPVAPADRSDTANFAQLHVNPAHYGTWSWLTDSELEF